ncbi:PLC-like phosphodiesterase [Trema orientale]|uniref:PLC-like phosphodiesterase n=1 Tax=Trema orientale TaxID=63057 RepID=A0A2P5E965_TREOI|nr:PLC-like phosphodiesterase [Trema orientale]
MGFQPNLVMITVALFFIFKLATAACSNGQCRLLDECSTDKDCASGLYCFSCPEGFFGIRCVRSKITDQFKLLNNSLPFNKYAFLTTHNSFAIENETLLGGIPRFTFTNQEDSVTQQLNNGVRALMLDTYDFKGDVWLCHSIAGQCHELTAFVRKYSTQLIIFVFAFFNLINCNKKFICERIALHTYLPLILEKCIGTSYRYTEEIESFLSSNPSEVVTLILEDYVQAPKGLTNVFTKAGLMKYWFPVKKHAQSGQDWPLLSDMVAKNQRLIVFTSIQAKEQTEGIAYRAESSPLDEESRSLVLVNYFQSAPVKEPTCEHNSGDLINMLRTCYGAAGNRWANFVAVDYYKVRGGAFQAVDTLNGKLLCGCDDIHACALELSFLNKFFYLAGRIDFRSLQFLTRSGW